MPKTNGNVVSDDYVRQVKNAVQYEWLDGFCLTLTAKGADLSYDLTGTVRVHSQIQTERITRHLEYATCFWAEGGSNISVPTSEELHDAIVSDWESMQLH